MAKDNRNLKMAEAAIANVETKSYVDDAPHGPPQPNPGGFPDFLWRGGPINIPRQQRILAEDRGNVQREWIMPDNSLEAQARRATEKIEDQKRRIFVANEEAPVTVSTRTDSGIKTVAVYQNMEDFRAGHDFAAYPFKEARGDKEQSAILVGAKPWAGKEPKVGAIPRPAGKSKAEMIGEMLLRPEGVTSKEVCTTMGWPSVSMPAQAKAVGMTLRKEKGADKVTRYWGIKSKK